MKEDSQITFEREREGETEGRRETEGEGERERWRGREEGTEGKKDHFMKYLI